MSYACAEKYSSEVRDRSDYRERIVSALQLIDPQKVKELVKAKSEENKARKQAEMEAKKQARQAQKEAKEAEKAQKLREKEIQREMRMLERQREVPEIKIEGEEEESERPRRNIPIVDYTGMDSVEPEDEFDGITDIWFDHSIDYDPDYVPEEDDELDGEMSVIPHDDCSSCCSANDCTEEEALEILAEYAEEERIEAEKQKKYDDLYKEKYNKMIADGWFADQAEFLATIHKFLAIIEDTPRAHMKIIHVQSMYVYIERNVKVMIVYIFEERKKSINRMLNQMSTKIVELKEQTIEHMAKGNIRASAMENLFSVMNSADQKIKETLNIINEVEVQE